MTFGSCLTFQDSRNSTDEFQHEAHGVIVPLLSTVDDARSLVKAAKFPPAGQRGFGSPFAMEKFGGVTQTEYLQQANESLLTIVQIETQDALNNVMADQHCIVVGLRRADEVTGRRDSPSPGDRCAVLRAVRSGQ